MFDVERPMRPDVVPSPNTGRERFQQATGADAIAMECMDSYLLLLMDWSSRMNLVGPSALAEFWDRHALDSAQLLDHAPDARVWADIGAGAGFPGLVLAILLKDRPGVTIHLIESMAKRCAFLRSVSVALNLPTQVHNARAESLKLSPVDVVTARACAPLPRLLEYAHPLLRSSVIGLFLKGKEAETELAEARKTWRFTASLIPSVSGTDGRIIRLERLGRV
jgi:16S rRNA (guanine527-N7)-methyltransferase